MDYNKLLNQTLLAVPPSGIRKYFDLLTDKTISLGVGEPDFPTPESIRKPALERLSKGRIPYSSNSGMPELRQLVARYLETQFDLKYELNEMLITVGTSQGMDLILRSILSPGDEVLVPEPTYISYIPIILLSGAVPVRLYTTAENRFKITPDLLEKAITDKTKALIMPYPNNPTGGIMERSDFEKILDLIKRRDIIVVTDEVYAELTFNGKKHVSIASMPGMWERTIVTNGFSKAFSMTGWRLGYAAGPRELIGAITKLHQITMLSAPTPAQYAGIIALEQGFVDGFKDMNYMKAEYAKRRRYIIDAFNELGMTCNEPEGAFYVFPSIRCSGLSSEEFCDRLLAQEDVCVVPGSAFGPTGEGHIRCCYATDLENIKEAMRRIKRFLESLK